MQRARIQANLKPVVWVASTREDLKSFPREVRRNVGKALDEAQRGSKADAAKPLKGFGGAGVLEVVENFYGDTYRAVYTVRLEGYIFVLHCFQKKAKHGVATTKQDLDLVHRRYRNAMRLHEQLKAQGEQP